MYRMFASKSFKEKPSFNIVDFLSASNQQKNSLISKKVFFLLILKLNQHFELLRNEIELECLKGSKDICHALPPPFSLSFLSTHIHAFAHTHAHKTCVYFTNACLQKTCRVCFVYLGKWISMLAFKVKSRNKQFQSQRKLK